MATALCTAAATPSNTGKSPTKTAEEGLREHDKELEVFTRPPNSTVTNMMASDDIRGKQVQSIKPHIPKQINPYCPNT